MIRSVAAIFAAFVVLNVVVMIGTFAAAPLARTATGVTQLTTAYMAVNLAVSAFAALLAGVVAAHIAPAKRFLHAGFLALLMAVLAVVMIASPPPEAAAQPKWYMPTLAVLGPLMALLGGWVRSRRPEAPEPTAPA